MTRRDDAPTADEIASSTHLKVGRLYTRADLKATFGITDSTLNTGIFKPKGHRSVWLFVTEQKAKDRPQYEDKLHGETLDWDSQPSGRADRMIIDHEQLGLELLLFYREKKNQYPGYAFRYEGRFVYVSHAGKQPAHFILGREAARHPIPLPPAAPSLPLPQAEPTPPVVTPPLEAPTRSPQAILAAGMQTFIQHMQAHGMAHEREVTAMFEHPRHYRRFVDVFDQVQQDWPFRVRIEMLSGVKVYKKDAHR